MKQFAERVSGMSLLRIYWYDGTSSGPGSQSIFLIQEADATYEWDERDLAPFMTCTEPLPEATQIDVSPGPTPEDGLPSILAGVAQDLVNEVAPQELESLVASVRATRQVPRQLDGRLLAKSRLALGQDLDSAQKREVRAAFLAACETRLASIAVARALPGE